MRIAITGLVTVMALGTTVANADSRTVEQKTNDVTVLKASTSRPDASRGVKLDLRKCSPRQADPYHVLDYDCTYAFELAAGKPALHKLVLLPDTYRNYEYGNYFCELLTVTTASKPSYAYAQGIGFHWQGRGLGGGAAGNFVNPGQLKEVGRGTFKDGETAVFHEFAALANCWLGSSSSSFAASYGFKPYMQFQNNEVRYRNWDQVERDYLISPAIRGFDRSAELLR